MLFLCAVSTLYGISVPCEFLMEGGGEAVGMRKLTPHYTKEKQMDFLLLP